MTMLRDSHSATPRHERPAKVPGWLSRRALLLGGLGIPVLAACGQLPGGGGSGGVRLVVADDVERVDPPGGTKVAPTVDGMTSFGHALVAKAATSADNFVASPASIAYAFGMVRAGALAGTAAQIDRVLGYPADGLHPALNVLTRQVVTTDKAPPRPSGKESRKPDEQPEPPVVTVANGLFAQEGFELKEPFLRTLAQHYGAGAQTLDLHAPEAADAINDWVREQTAERIDKLFDEIAAETVLILANAIYLKADWASPFEQQATRDDTFTRADGSTVRAPMMSRTGSMRHASASAVEGGDGFQAAELPYAGGELAMWVLVPTGDQDPTGLLDPRMLRHAADGFQPGRVRIVMPRWDFATNLQLKPALEELGMTEPFSDTAANFAGMSDDPLFIGQAIHRATITVDEWGTEAAAVTGVAMDVTSAPVGEPIEIRADRPFAFAIVHLPTKTPLFVGQVADPTAG
jgi:serine protease inhibitor